MPHGDTQGLACFFVKADLNRILLASVNLHSRNTINILKSWLDIPVRYVPDPVDTAFTPDLK